MRAIRNILFFIIGLILGSYATLSHADTYPVQITGYADQSNVFKGSTMESACRAMVVAPNTYSRFLDRRPNFPIQCYALNTSGTEVGSGAIYEQTGCPNGGTKSGTSCINAPSCVAPAVRNPTTGVCAIPPPTCTAGSTSYAGYGETRSFSLAGTEMATQACFNGCTINITGSPIGVGIKQPDGSFTTTTSGTVGSQTGASCTGTTGSTTTAAEDECLNQGKSFITASGSTTCVAPGTANSPPITKKTITSGTNTTSTGSTTTNTTTNTTVNNNQVTVTSTTVTTNPDGSTSTSVNSTNQPLNIYCQSNPSASLCTGGAFSNGTAGNGSSSCTGCATESTATAIKDKLTVDGSGSGDAAAGYPSVPDSFYTATYQNGLQGVWGDFKAQVNSTQFVSGINGFVPSGWDSGTAPSWNIDFSGLHAGWGSIEVSPASNIWFFIKIVFVVTTLFLCRTIIFGG